MIKKLHDPGRCHTMLPEKEQDFLHSTTFSLQSNGHLLRWERWLQPPECVGWDILGSYVGKSQSYHLSAQAY